MERVVKKITRQEFMEETLNRREKERLNKIGSAYDLERVGGFRKKIKWV